ncbi:MAG: hypothetical protein ACLGIN_14565 [Candidatus Sericytochromatia bacterium]
MLGGADTNGSTGVYYKGTTTLWQSDCGLNPGNAPDFSKNVGIWLGGGVSKENTVNYGDNKQYSWDVTGGLGGAYPNQNYAFGYRFDPAETGGNNVYFPGGPIPANEKGNSPPYWAPEFRNNPLNADPTPSTGKDDPRPMLTLDMSIARYVPTEPVKTAPVIDSYNKKVYAFNVNYLYCMDFSSPEAWSDTSTTTKTTTYNTAFWGTNGGAMFDNKNAFVQNQTAPVAAYDLSAIYVYNYYPRNGQGSSPPYSQYEGAVTKILLPLQPGTDRSSPDTGAPGTKVVNSLVSSGTNGGYLANPAASLYMVNDPFVNQYSTGGGIYFGLGATGRVYQFQP